MSTFKVGDVCVGQNFVYSTHRNGMECEVIGGLEMRTATDTVTGETSTKLRYKIRWVDGSVTLQTPNFLRKKRPPTTGEERVLAMFRQDQRQGVAA